MSTTGRHAGNEAVGHEAVGAYLLGVLDTADAAEFEAHLTGCAECGRRLGELGRLGPLLAELAALSPARSRARWRAAPADPAPRETVAATARPDPALLGRVVDEVAAPRRARRRRGRWLAAAAAVLIVGGPVAVALTADPGPVTATPAPAVRRRRRGRRAGARPVRRRSPSGGCRARRRPPTRRPGSARRSAWPQGVGTDAVLELRNVRGR
ncbi:zf-HC2 domain-containing protein [Streptomyces sp. M19]